MAMRAAAHPGACMQVKKLEENVLKIGEDILASFNDQLIARGEVCTTLT